MSQPASSVCSTESCSCVPPCSVKHSSTDKLGAVCHSYNLKLLRWRLPWISTTSCFGKKGDKPSIQLRCPLTRMERTTRGIGQGSRLRLCGVQTFMMTAFHLNLLFGLDILWRNSPHSCQC